MGILDTVDPSCVIGIVLCIVFLALFLAWLAADRDSVTITEPTPNAAPEKQHTANEPPALNTWSAIHTNMHVVYAPISADERMTPTQAERFISLLEAADHDDPPRTLPRTHCPLCIIEICDAWGIPFEQKRTIGAPVYCHVHAFAILATAKLGA